MILFHLYLTNRYDPTRGKKKMDYRSLAVLIFWITMGFTTAYIAKQRNRNTTGWFFIGLFFSLFGLLLLLVLPSKTPQTTDKENVKVPDIKAAYNEAAALSDDSMYREPSLPRISRDPTIDWYYVDSKSKISGPHKLPKLRKALIEGKHDSSTYIWCEEFLDWIQIGELQNGASLLDPDFLKD